MCFSYSTQKRTQHIQIQVEQTFEISINYSLANIFFSKLHYNRSSMPIAKCYHLDWSDDVKNFSKHT